MNLKQKQRFDIVFGSLLVTLLRIPVYLIGVILRREHSSLPKGDILFIKMQGGGSLLLAYPAILGIRNNYRQHKIMLLTTPAMLSFAENLAVFDKIILIEDKNLFALIASTFHSLLQTFGVDTVIDLEVYSRLTTVFSVATCARNRTGFFLDSARWRYRINTHLVFFNRFYCVCHFYEEVAKLLCSPLASLSQCRERLRKSLPVIPKKEAKKRISIGHGCSEMGAERKLTPEQWLMVFERRKITDEECIFLGGHDDYQLAEEIINKLKSVFRDTKLINMCGRLPLNESISFIISSDEFWGIDSSLLHYARLFKINNVSFWGPTDPMTRLREDVDVKSEIYYHKVPCSPCMHVAEDPPCRGKNICIRAIFCDYQINGDKDIRAAITARDCL